MKKLLLAIAVIFFAGNMQAQRIKLVDGNLKFLKGVKDLNLEYTYNDMKVGKYSEADYVTKKTEEYNKKEAGRGDKWANMWIEDREKRFEPRFELLFNKYIEKYDAIAEQGNKDAEYTMILHTYFTEPGYYIGISSAPASINCEAIFVKTSDPNTVLAKVDIRKAPGRAGAGWDTGERIKESYAKAGKELAKFLLKNKAFK
ncbi:MAG: hypothetical protein GXO80_02475 [Chlorobi bacterium]|nr:hypothetical protein [Chlorobiota bacterium]